MTELPPIPVPLSQRWREIRVKYVPVLLVATLVGVTIPLWRSTVVPTNMTGVLEAIRADVISPDAGVVTNLYVTRFQEVKAGDLVAEIISTDTRKRDSRVQALRGHLALAQIQMGSTIDSSRLAFDYQALLVEHLTQQVELETARAELGPSEEEARRLETMLKENVGSLQDYTEAAKVVASLRAKIKLLEPSAAGLSDILRKASTLGDFSIQENGAGLRDTLKTLAEEQAKLDSMQEAPVQLLAPIDGVVLEIHRSVGQNLLEGDPVLTIGAKNSGHIIGYVKQPISVEPTPGMRVKVLTRRTPRSESWGEILAVGAQFEAITNVALLRADGRADHGLPVSVSLPAPFKSLLHPGEVVDLHVQAK